MEYNSSSKRRTPENHNQMECESSSSGHPGFYLTVDLHFPADGVPKGAAGVDQNDVMHSQSLPIQQKGKAPECSTGGIFSMPGTSPTMKGNFMASARSTGRAVSDFVATVGNTSRTVSDLVGSALRGSSFPGVSNIALLESSGGTGSSMFRNLMLLPSPHV